MSPLWAFPFVTCLVCTLIQPWISFLSLSLKHRPPRRSRKEIEIYWCSRGGREPFGILLRSLSLLFRDLCPNATQGRDWKKKNGPILSHKVCFFFLFPSGSSAAAVDNSQKNGFNPFIAVFFGHTKNITVTRSNGVFIPSCWQLNLIAFDHWRWGMPPNGDQTLQQQWSVPAIVSAP